MEKFVCTSTCAAQQIFSVQQQNSDTGHLYEHLGTSEEFSQLQPIHEEVKICNDIISQN